MQISSYTSWYLLAVALTKISGYIQSELRGSYLGNCREQSWVIHGLLLLLKHSLLHQCLFQLQLMLVLQMLLLHHCINSGTLTFCASALIQSAVSQQLWQQENCFFFKKRITTCNYSNASQKMSRIKSQCCTSFNIYISSHNGLINFHISAQHLWTELQSFGGKLAPPSYNTQNALNYKSQRLGYICMQLQRKIIYNLTF